MPSTLPSEESALVHEVRSLVSRTFNDAVVKRCRGLPETGKIVSKLERISMEGNPELLTSHEFQRQVAESVHIARLEFVYYVMTSIRQTFIRSVDLIRMELEREIYQNTRTGGNPDRRCYLSGDLAFWELQRLKERLHNEFVKEGIVRLHLEMSEGITTTMESVHQAISLVPARRPPRRNGPATSDEEPSLPAASPQATGSHTTELRMLEPPTSPARGCGCDTASGVGGVSTAEEHSTASNTPASRIRGLSTQAAESLEFLAEDLEASLDALHEVLAWERNLLEIAKEVVRELGSEQRALERQRLEILSTFPAAVPDRAIAIILEQVGERGSTGTPTFPAPSVAKPKVKTPHFIAAVDPRIKFIREGIPLLRMKDLMRSIESVSSGAAAACDRLMAPRSSTVR